MTETKPAELKDGFDQPTPVNDAQIAFGKIDGLMPAYDTVPAEFKTHAGNQWVDFVNAWFFGGAKGSQLTPRDDVDPQLALRHAAAVLKSWEPKHEHKTAAVAWLLSRWFQAVTA